MSEWRWVGHDSNPSDELAGDPLTIDTPDFFALAPVDRHLLAAWLWPITGHGIGSIERIRLGEGSVDVTTIDWAEEGVPVRVGDDFATTTRRYVAPVPPPVWKPLR